MIKQHTQEWLDAKLNTIGGSEIWSLVWHYKKEELRKIEEQHNINILSEKPFKSPMELFIKIKHNLQDDSFSSVNREFGLAMEPYITSRLNTIELRDCVSAVQSEDFIQNKEIHSLASCSPDGYVNFVSPMEYLIDDKGLKVSSDWGVGVLELKTTRYFDSLTAEQGARYQYIFQIQYQMMVLGLKWGILATINPKQADLDNEFQKGKSVQAMEVLLIDYLNEIYDCNYYVYSAIPAIQRMIKESLVAFQEDLDNDNYASLIYGEDPMLIKKDRKALSLAFPDRYGTLQLDLNKEEDKAINDLINQRMYANIEENKIKAEKDHIYNQLLEQTRKYNRVIGSDYEFSYVSTKKCSYLKFKEIK